MSKTLDEIVEMGLFSRPFLAWASYASEEEISAYFDVVFGRVGDGEVASGSTAVPVLRAGISVSEVDGSACEG